MRAFLALLALLVGLAAQPGKAGAQEVDVLLVLGFDCSYSVGTVEFFLQRNGMAAAFRNPEVLQAIADGPNGRIAVSVVQWSSWESQVLTTPWTLIDGPATAEAFAQELDEMVRLTADGATSISGAIYYGAQLIKSAPFVAFRKVIDISGDGRNNNGPPLPTARDLAVAQGITVNGLAILNETPDLDLYYDRELIGGVGSFVEVSNSYRDYPEALRRKLIREISLQPLSQAPDEGADTQLSEFSSPRPR